MEIHHIGYLTKDLKAAEKAFLNLGFKIERAAEYDPYRQLDISFLLNGPYRVELIQPKDEESPFFPLLKKYKNTPYHFCYTVEKLSSTILDLEDQGYRVIQNPLRAPCLDNREVAFLSHADMGIIELVKDNGSSVL